MGAPLAPPSLPTTVSCTWLPKGRPPSAGSARQMISKPLEGRLEWSNRLRSFGKPGAGAIAGGAPPPGTNADALTASTVLEFTVAEAIDSLKRMVTSGLVGPKIAVRMSAMLEEGAPEGGGGGGTPAPMPWALLTGFVTTTTGAIVSDVPTVKEWKTGALSTGSPSVDFRFPKTPMLYWPLGSGSVAGTKRILSFSTMTWL